MRKLHLAAIPLMVSTLALSGCITSGAKTGGARLAEPVLSADKIEFDVSTPAAFAGKKEITISGFKVAFITSMKGSHSSAGFNMGDNSFNSSSKARVTATVQMNDIPKEVMQKITDEAYRDFKAKLIAQGYTIRPYAELEKKFDKLAKLETESVPFETDTPRPGVTANALVFSPSELKMRLRTGEAGVTKIFGSPSMAYSEVAEENGIPFVDVYYAVNFASFGGDISNRSASLSVGQRMSVLDRSGLWIYGGLGGTFSSNIGSMYTEQPLANTLEFADISVKEKTAAEETDQKLANALVFLFGGGEKMKNTYIYKIDGERYQKASLDVLTKVNTALSNKMAALSKK